MSNRLIWSCVAGTHISCSTGAANASARFYFTFYSDDSLGGSAKITVTICVPFVCMAMSLGTGFYCHIMIL